MLEHSKITLKSNLKIMDILLNFSDI